MSRHGRRLGAPVLCGVASWGILHAGSCWGSGVVPECVLYVAWLVLVIALAAMCGMWDPNVGWRAGAVIIGVQPLCFLTLAVVTGELVDPERSTGGVVAIGVMTGLMAVISPIPMLAGELGSRWRLRRDAGGK
jgi:hypothetical protein